MARNLRNIDLNLLSIFVALMRDKNLSHTADNLGMTQPAVSQALKRLRALYNDPLFERKAGKMHPTRKAESIYPVINNTLSEVMTTFPDSDKFIAKEAELEFRINILSIDNRDILGKIVQTIEKIAPEVSLIISNDILIDAQKSLRNREYDIHIDYLSIAASDCHFDTLFEDKLFIIARKQHPRLGDKKTLLMSDYLAEKHAVLAPRKDNVYPLKQALNYFKAERDIKYTSSSIQNIIEIIGVTDYVCIMPGSALQSINHTEDYVWFTPPFKTTNVIAYMNWHWAMEHVQSHQWLRHEISKIYSNIELLE
jgi:LysR family transcriptional activator for leuABCD operon